MLIYFVKEKTDWYTFRILEQQFDTLQVTTIDTTIILLLFYHYY